MNLRPKGQNIKVKRTSENTQRQGQTGQIVGYDNFSTPTSISIWYEVEFNNGEIELFQPHELKKA